MSDRAFPYYPLFLDISGKRCLVVGGGPVACRKVKALLECGSSVVVVSPEVCPEMRDMVDKEAVSLALREYRTEDMDGALVVIAATDDAEVNRRVAADARDLRLLVNVVDDMEVSSFIAPSYLRRGDLTIAVSTEGRSPALARRIREKLEAEIGDEYGYLVALLGQLREEFKERGIRVPADVWHEALALEPLVALLRQGHEDEAKALLIERLGVAARLDTG